MSGIAGIDKRYKVLGMKRLFIGMVCVMSGALSGLACTGVSFTAKDGSYVQARTIEWAKSPLESQYVIIPRGERLVSDAPESEGGGLSFTAKYGIVGLSVVKKEYIAEGINEAGLSAGLFFFPGYGAYKAYDPARKSSTLADMQVVQWMLSRFATVEEVMAHISEARIVGLVPEAVVHWRIGDPSGRQVVLEIVDGEPRFYENTVGVLTNAPGFEWHLANLKNYVNLFPGDAPEHSLSALTLRPLGGNSGFLGLPGDATPPSRFVRAAFFRATAPQQPTAFRTVTQCFQLLSNFDIPIGIEHPVGESPDMPSATQWTVVTDLTHRKVYYRTAYNTTIRCISLGGIDFGRVKYQAHPLDKTQEQPVEQIVVR